MNAHVQFEKRLPVKLTCSAFLTLKRSGAFAAYEKSELLDGEISGVPRQEPDEPESDASVPIKLRVEDYGLLQRSHELEPYGRTELIDGDIYAMSPQYRPHGYAKDELAYRMRRALEKLALDVHVATDQSITLSAHSEPQPDIILTTEPRGEGPIPGGTVRLIVEVADTTVRFDLDAKAGVYATAGVAEYWVVDVNARIIYRMTTPTGETYGVTTTHPFGDAIEAATIAGLRIDTSAL
ncbi:MULTISPECIES: Uma2 family endonuclease [unclassified Sphingomonas]|jgi:Uma2 family endonuclease|uniref:Uma2 family endonuclease n=1 Tax=unclassified Sphingomonas TaxID=196159 RepID=UPI00082BFFD9|nr:MULTISPECIES: Uma2 family endonuclease [unclassified Sphingomonas]